MTQREFDERFFVGVGCAHPLKTAMIELTLRVHPSFASGAGQPAPLAKLGFTRLQK
jgi:hypothetical protein